MLSVIMLSVIMLSVIMLSVIMLSVDAPKIWRRQNLTHMQSISISVFLITSFIDTNNSAELWVLGLYYKKITAVIYGFS